MDGTVLGLALTAFFSGVVGVANVALATSTGKILYSIVGSFLMAGCGIAIGAAIAVALS